VDDGDKALVDGERISLRLEPEDLELIDEFVAQHPEFSNRSHLARMALRAFIEKDDATISKSSNDRVAITISGRMRGVIEKLVEDKYYASVEQGIEFELHKIFLSKRMASAIDQANEDDKKILERM
jgi:Arc/MetJ-type ribon-helix-helix transcriptional regulator